MKILKYRKKFGMTAKAYQRYRSAYDARVFKRFFRLLGKREASVLDLGCGTGKSTEPLAKGRMRVIGADPDPMMLREARASARARRLPIRYVQAEAEHLPFADASFDAVTVGTAFHWFEHKKALREIRRVLCADGLLFVFWQVSPGAKVRMHPELRDLFKRYRLKFIPERLTDASHTRRLLERNGWKPAHTARIPVVQRLTLAERVGLFRTFSSYHALPANRKERFLADLAVAYRRMLGKRKRFTLKREVQVCYGRVTPPRTAAKRKSASP